MASCGTGTTLKSFLLILTVLSLYPDDRIGMASRMLLNNHQSRRDAQGSKGVQGMFEEGYPMMDLLLGGR